MPNRQGSIGARRALSLALVAILAGVASRVPAGIGNVGRAGDKGAGGSLTTTVNPTFSVKIGADEPIATARDELVAQIDADPNFQAASVVDPGDPNANSFQVLRRDGSEVDRMQLCSTDPNIDNLGASFPAGKGQTSISKVTAVNADGQYRLVIDMWDSPDFDQPFDTKIPPNDTASGLNASIVAALTAARYTVVDDGANLTIRRGIEKIMATRISSSDTGVVSLCIELAPAPPGPGGTGGGAIPTLSQYGMFALVLLLTGAAIMVLRRRQVQTR